MLAAPLVFQARIFMGELALRRDGEEQGEGNKGESSGRMRRDMGLFGFGDWGGVCVIEVGSGKTGDGSGGEIWHGDGGFVCGGC